MLLFMPAHFIDRHDPWKIEVSRGLGFGAKSLAVGHIGKLTRFVAELVTDVVKCLGPAGGNFPGKESMTGFNPLHQDVHRRRDCDSTSAGGPVLKRLQS